jgi:DNA-binding CsgD family transcriptional regulator/predicted negative regulator of RcsB-dependent stress response
VPAWRKTYERLTELDRASPLDPPRLFELAQATYLIGKDAQGFATLVRAHQGFVQRRQLREAGGIAARIASMAMSAGDAAQAAGWMARAARLLEESGGPCAELGHLLLAEARQSLLTANIDNARAKFAEAAALGERFGDVDLTNLARQGLGRTLIELGEIERGVELLDEVMVAVTAGEVSAIIAGIIYCSVLSACWDLSDIGRAREWTDALTRWCAAQPDMVPYRGECLVHRAEIISLQGVWPEALNEAVLACERLSEPPGQPAFGAALYQLAELHRLRGDHEKAEEAYRKSAESGRSPYPGLALLRLAQGRRDDALASMRRVLQEARHRRTRSKILGAAVEIMLAAGDVAAARQAADELGMLAQTLNTPFLRARAAGSEGAVLLAEGNAPAALTASRTAWGLWRELEVPYEAARARVLIAQACRALGDKDSADLELEAARQTFDHLEARPDAARLAEIAASGRPAAGLTDRELQVLRLVATGRTNRAIADDLGLSEKTVARHVSNIFNKLNVSSRAAATAYAFEHHLTERPTT